MTYDEMGVFEQLKPLYGQQIDKVWYRYLAADPREKGEIIKRLQLHAASIQKKAIGNRKIYLEPPRPDVIGGGEYHLGNVIFPGKTPYPATINRDELCRHALFSGPTGSGKTTLILNLMEQLQADGIPWMALDWKGSFGVLMKAKGGDDVIVLTIESDAAPLRINMLLPPPRVNMNAWIENLSDCIADNHLLKDGAQSALKSALYDAIQQYGKRATLRDALSFVKQQKARVMPRSREYGWIESTERALTQLTTGPYGDCVNEPEHPMLVGDLLRMKVAINLTGLGQAQGSTLCTFFLQSTLLTRQKQQGPKEVLQHVTLLDEAQHVFRPEAPWEPLSLASRVIREVREFGEAVIAAAQGVRLCESLLHNTNTKAIMCTDGKAELDHYSKSFQIDPFLFTIIPTGQAIGKIPERHKKPFLFSFKQNKLKNTIITDEEIKERYEAWRAGTPRTTNEQPRNVVIGPKELALLRDIATKPLDSITQHYENLGWNPKTGNNVKDYLVRHEIITLRTVQRGRSQLKFATITKEGTRRLAPHGITTTAHGPGGTEHEYWRNEIRKLCEEKHYTVTTEYHLGAQRHVDLHAARDGRNLLIEIETGKSDITNNIEKCAGKGTLIMFFTTKQAYEQAQPLPNHLITITPDTINTFNDLLD